ncbi:SGNH/GDSL hydrolase family protein [Pseudomonas fulva]|uniref:SGNH/GDSL hydrolase family protein n=1 Tax=Pseudomonas fulva TaxID=47880 RepID=UPI0037F75EDC
MANNTLNPVPSSDPRDLVDNATTIDLIINSGADRIPGRFGQMLYTWGYFHRLVERAVVQIDGVIANATSQVNSARDEAIEDMAATAAALGSDLNNKHYSTYAKMLADPQNRDAVVAVVDADPNIALNGWYFWDKSASEWKHFVQQPAQRAELEKKVPTVSPTSPLRLPLVITESGQVVAWLDEGNFGAAGLTPALRKNATMDVVTRLASPNTALFPLMATELGQVVCWMEDGKFNAAGMNSTIASMIQAALDPYQLKFQPKVTDGSNLYAYRAKIANALGGGGQARVIFTGDSWTEHLAETAQPLSQALYGAYGQAGQGWIGMDADEGGASSTLSQLLNGARLVKSTGWTLADMTLVADSLDGHAAVATGTTANITVSNLKTQSLTWYYKDGDGTFRYSVDGAEPIAVAGGNTGARKSLTISGLSDASHSIVFDLVGNTGTVTMYGGMGLRTAPGVEFSKAGNGGSTAVQWKALAPYVQAYAAELKPDLAIIILGTNDKNQGISKDSFKSGVRSMVDAYRTGSPNCCVVLVCPTLAQNTTDPGLLTGYGEAMYEITQETSGVEFLNLNSFMPPRIVSSTMGLWKDSLHLSEAGGRFLTGLLMKYLLRTN